MHECVTCGETKPPEDYTPAEAEAAALGTRRPRCAECARAARRRSYHRNKERSRALQHTPQRKLSRIKANAKRRGIPFALTFRQVLHLVDAPCDYCGATVDGMQLDRVDSARGYTLDNVVPSCDTCNQAKNAMSREAFLGLVARIAARHPEADPTVPLDKTPHAKTHGRPRQYSDEDNALPEGSAAAVRVAERQLAAVLRSGREAGKEAAIQRYHEALRKRWAHG